MTLFDLINLPTLKGLKIIAGELGIHKNISGVTIVDTPDGFDWLMGNEVVITTGYALKATGTSLSSFIKSIVNKNASALIIKTNRYITHIPADALKIANELNFTLLTCPEEYAFSDIINPVLTNIINKQNIYLNLTAQIHNKFMQLAINNNSIPEILTVLSSFLKRDTIFIDTYFNKCYYSNSQCKIAPYLSTVEDYKALKKDELKDYTLYNVANKYESFGLILTEKSTEMPDDEESNIHQSLAQTAYEYASIVIILRMQMRISNHMVDEKYKNSFLEDILLNNIKTESEIHSRSKLYDWDFSNGGQVLLLDINKIKKYYTYELDSNTNEKLKLYTEKIFSAAIDTVESEFPNAKHYILSDLIAFVLSLDEKTRSNSTKKYEDIFKTIRHKISEETPFTVTIGVGNYYDNIINLHKSYKEAKTSVEVGYMLDRFDCILHYKNMEIYHLLKRVSDSREADFYCKKYIIPLVNYDKLHHSDLVLTLQEIVNNGWNIKLAAEKLYIHYNSAKYRFQKMCDLLNMDLREHDTQLMIELALKMYFINGIKLI